MDNVCTKRTGGIYKLISLPSRELTSKYEMLELLDEFSSKFDGAEVTIVSQENLEQNMYVLGWLKKNNKIIAIHGIDLNYCCKENYLNLYKHVRDFVGSTIDITTHPSNERKVNVLSVKEVAKHAGMRFNVENLNNLNGVARMGLNKSVSFVSSINLGPIGICYDIGHEYMDSGNDNVDLISNVNKVRTIHIHSISDKDHDCLDINHPYSKAIKELIRKGFSGNIVLEVAFDYVKGETFRERFIGYINQMDILDEFIHEL